MYGRWHSGSETVQSNTETKCNQNYNTFLSGKNTCKYTDRIRPPVLKFSQASPLFCRGKHQGAQSEEQTNNKLTHSPVTLCLDCKHKRASVCLRLCVCVCVQPALQWTAVLRKRKKVELRCRTWCITMATCRFHTINLPTVRSIQMSTMSLFHSWQFRNAEKAADWQWVTPIGSHS